MLELYLFFKLKTAYEMRISDCSSDVCSSDLWIDAQMADHRRIGCGLGLGRIGGYADVADAVEQVGDPARLEHPRGIIGVGVGKDQSPSGQPRESGTQPGGDRKSVV